ncbi:unnamed protein product, partial [Ambrosiozyma monospora]
MSDSLRKEINEHLITIFSTSQKSSYGKDCLASRLVSTILQRSNDQLLHKMVFTCILPSIDESNFHIYSELIEYIFQIDLEDRIQIIQSSLGNLLCSSSKFSSVFFTELSRCQPKGSLETLFIWFRVVFTSVESVLNYNSPSENILAIKNLFENHWTKDNLNQSAMWDTTPDKVFLSKFYSVVIYGTCLFSSTSIMQVISAKRKFHLNVTREDEVGLLAYYVQHNKFKEALKTIEKNVSMYPDFLNDETLENVYTTLAKTEKWDLLAEQMELIFSNNRTPTFNQYLVLMASLAQRGASKEILTLWENFLRKGYQPTDTILCLIVSSFLKSGAYSEALQWFSAFSHYKVPLTSKAYQLMVECLSGLKEIKSCLTLLEELESSSVFTPDLITLKPIFECCIQLGDSATIEFLIQKYLPAEKEGLFHYVLSAHLAATRSQFVLKSYFQLLDSGKADLNVSVVALQAAAYENKQTEVIFNRVWDSVQRNFSKLPAEAYFAYLKAKVKSRGFYTIENDIKSLCDFLHVKNLPIKFYNAIIDAAIYARRPEVVRCLISTAIKSGTLPNSRTYSLFLLSHTATETDVKNNLEYAMEALDEILLNRRQDKLGKLDQDLDPKLFKLFVMRVLKYKGSDEARRLFDLYIENSKSYLLDNCHVLSLELMLLGEESRWNDFVPCYERFCKLLQDQLNYSKFKNQKEYSATVGNISASGTRTPPGSLDFSHALSESIPSVLKKAHWAVWYYRLKQLVEMGELKNVVQE